MSSTSRDEKEALARDFYARELLPLAREAAARGHRYLEPGPDPALPTYYQRRKKTRWTAADFESQAVDSPAALAPLLAAHWTATGDVGLAARAGAFAELAAQVYDVETEAGSVTPFMYVMF